MQTTGVFNVILEKDAILLVKRKDLPLWDLPGGTLEKNETIIACAIRECYEETGLKVDVNRTVGKYFNPERNDLQIIVTSHIISGTLKTQGPETKDVRFFSLHNLPLNLIPARRMQIKQAATNEAEIYQEIKENKLIKFFRNYF